MTMGLILLGVMALLLLFSFGRNAFRGLWLTPGAAFFAVLAFAVGIIVPSIPLYRGGFYMTVGGFVLPVVASIALIGLLIRHGGVLRSIAGMLAVVAVTVGLMVVMPMGNIWMRMLAAWVIGLVAGAVAFLVARTRASSAFAVLGGVAVGDLIYSLISYFAYRAGVVTLGGDVAYNSIFVGVLFALILAEAAVRLGKSVGSAAATGRRGTNYEAAKDEKFDSPDKDYDHFDDELF